MSVTKAIASLLETRSATALHRALAAEVGSGGRVVENVGLDAEAYRWHAAPERGMLLDKMFVNGMDNATEATPSEAERAGVHTKSDVTLDALTFGQVPPRAVSTILNRIRMIGGEKSARSILDDREGVFVDLGSGDGITCASAAMCAPFREAIGVEIVPSLHARAQSVAEVWNESVIGAGPSFENIGKLKFSLGDARHVDWHTEASVVFANAPCFDAPLMHVLSQQAAQLQPGALFVTVGKPLRSEFFDLIDQVRLPANGLGMFGEPGDCSSEMAHASGGYEEGLLDPEDEEAIAAGLFTFNVYQRIMDDDCDRVKDNDWNMLPVFTDTVSQQTIRETSCIPLMVDILKDSGNDVTERATAALALRSCLESSPSVRQSLRAGIVSAAFGLLHDHGNAMPLQVCGVLLLNSLSVHRVGQVAMLGNDDDNVQAALRNSLTRMLLKGDVPAAVVDAGVETLYNLSSSPEGCALISSTDGIYDRLTQLSKSAGGVDDTMSARAQATCDQLRMDWN